MKCEDYVLVVAFNEDYKILRNEGGELVRLITNRYYPDGFLVKKTDIKAVFLMLFEEYTILNLPTGYSSLHDFVDDYECGYISPYDLTEYELIIK